ncbi:hypothetical protein KOEU_10880 [Komagataeibacter europaeus]|uniref:Uncharacterized protein n=1 Tax=Komagataeibacter europaeus TaxID=33995 RepID=A0A0M0EJ13_KOMEU|nr:hypothetical protein [Komagataeibacter europaeus]ARW15666.1 hypothetical protein S101446_00525 [Komagataeibacter europaeus]KON65248.1 hypothetical protein KOEU_10880 [Komagataeibacter europaeus]
MYTNFGLSIDGEWYHGSGRACRRRLLSRHGPEGGSGGIAGYLDVKLARMVF